MYHRIGDVVTDPWQLSVTSKNFEEQLKVLKKTERVIALTELIDKVERKDKIENSIIITFDDGYKDNYTIAKPLLEKYQLPATFFISTQHIDSSKEFWWDELAFIFLEADTLPSILHLQIEDTFLEFDLGKETVLTKELKENHKKWDAYSTPTTARSKAFLEIWSLVSKLRYQDQQDCLARIKEWAGIVNNERTAYLSMSRQELTELSSNSLFAIGGHTVTHPALSLLSPHSQDQEVEGCKAFLAKITNTNIESFAYPSGIYNETTMDVLKKNNFKIAFTTEENSIVNPSSPYQCGRYQVNNWTGQSFNKFISKWM